MKKIIIGTIVGTVIFFLYQSAMWMGGFHNNLSIYSSVQDSVLKQMNDLHFTEGVYFIPSADPAAKDYQKEMQEKMKTSVGKPWAMVFYHSSMKDVETPYILMGLLYTFISILIAVTVLYYAKFGSFTARFLAVMAFGLFTIFQSVLSDMNWWNYPWNFIKPHVVDLTFGWALCAVWLAFYVKNKVPKEG